MPRYTVKLMRKEAVAEGTMAFYFEKASGFQSKPAQFVNLTLVNPPETDAQSDVRTFSIASARHEEDLMVATRLRDTAFKRIEQRCGTSLRFSRRRGWTAPRLGLGGSLLRDQTEGQAG